MKVYPTVQLSSFKYDLNVGLKWRLATADRYEQFFTFLAGLSSPLLYSTRKSYRLLV
jgi:hypothetical protein